MTAALALTDTELENIHSLRVAGHSLREIGQRTGRHWTTVHAALAGPDRPARIGDAAAIRATIARSHRISRYERLRLLGIDDATMLDARDHCLLHDGQNAAQLAANVPGMSENLARLWLRVFWWVSRPVSLRAQP